MTNLQLSLKEPNARIIIGRHELLALCIEIDKAFAKDGGDAEYDALLNVRDRLIDYSEDPRRRLLCLHEDEGVTP